MDNFLLLTHTNNMKKSTKVKNKNFGKPNKFDVNGSYTGTSLLPDLKPVQDADDL